MQKIISVKTPTPQNISKWSISRKGIIKNIKFLKNQLDSKISIISKLKKENNELKIKVKLNGLEFINNLSDSKMIYFDFQFLHKDEDSIFYLVENDELSYSNEVEIPLCEILEHFEDCDISQEDLDSFINDYLLSSISY